jgi:2-amino-4-hydroxy-6-hydroxymethyldihydropteridine diphosphokinase
VQLIIGLGGNLGDPPETFRRALARSVMSRRVIAVSSLYRSQPVGPPQPKFWNAAALLEIDWPPLELLDVCHAVEVEEGRRRGRDDRWGPRTLDIDLLAADGVVHRGPRLELPHPRFGVRSFALIPAAELAGHWVHPVIGKTIGILASAARSRNLDAVSEPIPFKL